MMSTLFDTIQNIIMQGSVISFSEREDTQQIEVSIAKGYGLYEYSRKLLITMDAVLVSKDPEAVIVNEIKKANNILWETIDKHRSIPT